MSISPSVRVFSPFFRPSIHAHRRLCFYIFHSRGYIRRFSFIFFRPKKSRRPEKPLALITQGDAPEKTLNRRVLFHRVYTGRPRDNVRLFYMTYSVIRVIMFCFDFFFLSRVRCSKNRLTGNNNFYIDRAYKTNSRLYTLLLSH